MRFGLLSKIVLFLIFYFHNANAQTSIINTLNNFNTIDKNIKSIVSPAQIKCNKKFPKIVQVPKICHCKVNQEKKPKNSGVLQVSFYMDNDNVFMGLVQYVPRLEDGDDFGFTHAEGMKIKYIRGKNEFTVNASSGLYSNKIRDTHNEVGQVKGQNTIQNTLQNQYGSVYVFNSKNNFTSSGYINENVVRLEDIDALTNDYQKTKDSIRFVDLSRVIASWKRGDTTYITGSLGFEKRSRVANPRDLVSAANTQDWWHGKVLKTYQFDYVSPDAHSALVGTTHTNSKTAQSQNQYYNYQTNTFETNTLTQTVTNSSSQILRSSIDQENLKTPISKYSALASFGVGAKQTMFSGKCTINSEVGGNLSTETDQLIGPNSNFYITSEVHGAFGKTKSGAPRFEPILENTVFLYPTAGVVSGTKLGDVPKLTLQTNYQISKKGTVLSPFFTMELPLGRQEFEEFNDADPIMRIGLTLAFGQKN